MEKVIKTELIENYLKENQISKTKFCKMCKISPYTFKKVMSNDLNFDARVIFKIARVLNIEAYMIFNK